MFSGSLKKNYSKICQVQPHVPHNYLHSGLIDDTFIFVYIFIFDFHLQVLFKTFKRLLVLHP